MNGSGVFLSDFVDSRYHSLANVGSISAPKFCASNNCFRYHYDLRAYTQPYVIKEALSNWKFLNSPIGSALIVHSLIGGKKGKEFSRKFFEKSSKFFAIVLFQFYFFLYQISFKHFVIVLVESIQLKLAGK